MDLSFLRPLYERPGPWTSVMLDASRDTEDGGKAVALRLAALRADLEGAPPADLEAVEAAVEADRGEGGPHNLAVLVNGGEVVLGETLPPGPERAVHARLPDVMPLIAGRGDHVAWLRVLLDRAGADLTASAGEIARIVEGGQQYPLHKTRMGGWSAPRRQRAVEVAWDRNATDVADVVAGLAESTGAEVVVLAGDVRARQLCRERLPKTLRVVETESGPDQLDDAVAAAVAEVAAEQRDDLLDRFHTHNGHDGATGLGGVVRALAAARANTLFTVPTPVPDRELWIGPTPTDLATTADELRASGVTDPALERADSAIVRAAVMTGADLVLLDGDAPADGLGALLRY